jgi:hypothetical protein
LPDFDFEAKERLDIVGNVRACSAHWVVMSAQVYNIEAGKPEGSPTTAGSRCEDSV